MGWVDLRKGDVASELAVNAVRAFLLYQHANAYNGASLLVAMEARQYACVSREYGAIYPGQGENDGNVLCPAVLFGDTVYVANVGDSRTCILFAMDRFCKYRKTTRPRPSNFALARLQKSRRKQWPIILLRAALALGMMWE